MSDHDSVWTAVAQLLRAQVSEAVWFSTFQDVTAIDNDGVTLRVSAPNGLGRERILTRYLPLVREALDEIGSGHLQFEVELRSIEPEPITDWTPEPVPGSSTPATAVAPGESTVSTREQASSAGGLNPRYTFDTFVKGASNQFALAAALRVAETPGRSYNPLFIYGSAGLGKTHLLHAIGHYVLSHYQHDIVRYVTTETFLNEYVDAIRTNSTASFKRRYRDIDVLLIDDIQFMEGKEGLQEEFFHTFNTLHGANKQIIISSDRMPDNIPTLEERLRGRFKWGLITDIQPPDLETRLAILRNKAERDLSPVPPDVLEFIASNITSNIRELEGALIRVTAFASLNRVPISVALAEQLLGAMISTAYVKPRTDEELLEELAVLLGFKVELLRSKNRQRPLVTARQIAMYIFRELTDLSYPAIGRLFGGRDHTTVMHAVGKIEHLMGERKQVYDQVTDIVHRVRQA